MKKLTGICIAGVLSMMTVSVEGASKLYGTIGHGYTDGSTLIELNPTTGGFVSTIGSVGYIVNGLAYDATSGKLYGGTSFNDATYNGLIEIDMTTGVGTPIGVHGWGLTGSATAVTNIAINSAGEMFGWWDPTVDDLVWIDKTTGIATVVADSGLFSSEHGLAFDNDDNLYLFNGDDEPKPVYEINTSTGAATHFGDITGFPDGYGEDVHHGDFDPDTNLYYGISDWGNFNPRAIHVVDMSDLSITSTLPTVDNLHTLAFISDGGGGGGDDEGPVTSNVAATPSLIAVNTDDVILTATVDDSATGNSAIASAEYSLDGTTWQSLGAADGTFDSPIEAVIANLGQFSVGVYDIGVRGTDSAGNLGPPAYCLLVVYDPTGGFVTGGGWIYSEPGNYTVDPLAEGVAYFGFVSKYKKRAEAPIGRTEFEFHAGDLDFYSSGYEWLVVNQGGSNAQFKGSGTINGAGGYKFMVRATDGEPDTFRIFIWDEISDLLVYDNGSHQQIGGGSIIVHKGKK